MDQDNVRMTMKFSALNVDFNSLLFDLLGSRSRPYGGVKLGIPSNCAISATVD